MTGSQALQGRRKRDGFGVEEGEEVGSCRGEGEAHVAAVVGADGAGDELLVLDGADDLGGAGHGDTEHGGYLCGVERVMAAQKEESHALVERDAVSGDEGLFVFGDGALQVAYFTECHGRGGILRRV